MISDKEKWVTRILVISLIAHLFLQRATLVDKIHDVISITSGVTGFALGAWWAQRLSLTQRFQENSKGLLALGLIPIMMIFVGTYVARTTAEFLGFLGKEPAIQSVEARVISIDRSRKWTGYHATIRVGDYGREIRANVSSGLYASLEPWRFPGRDCLLIQVEEGRAGLRRTILPNLFDEPMGIERYRKCASG